MQNDYNREQIIPKSYTQRERADNYGEQNFLTMPKIAEEAAISTHSEMNTTEFFNQYVKGVTDQEDSSGQLCSGRNARCHEKLCDGFADSSNVTPIISPIPQKLHHSGARPFNALASENRGDIDNLPSAREKSSFTVYDGMLDSHAFPSSQMGSTSEVLCNPVTLTDFKNQDRSPIQSAQQNHNKQLHPVRITVEPASGSPPTQDSPVSVEEDSAEVRRAKGTSLAHFVQRQPLPFIDPETNFITSLVSSSRGSKRNLLKGMSNANLVVQEEGQLATFRAVQFDNQLSQKATTSRQQNIYIQERASQNSGGVQQPVIVAQQQQSSTLSKYLVKKKKVVAQQKGGPEKTCDHFNLGTTFLIESSSGGGRFSHQQQHHLQPKNLLDESVLSAEQREELSHLRYIKEPGVLMVPQESLDEVEFQNTHQRPQSAEYSKTQRIGGQPETFRRRRATANFGRKPEIRERNQISSVGRTSDSSFLQPHKNDSIPSVSIPDSSTFCPLDVFATTAEPPKMDDEESLIRNLFYLKNERPIRQVYETSVGKVIHKAMQYRCVTGQSSNHSRKIQVDLLDFVESLPCESNRTILEELSSSLQRERDTQQTSSLASQNGPPATSPTAESSLKHRSLIYFNVSSSTVDGENGDYVNNEIMDAVKEEKRFGSFEHMYGQITEKLVARVIENEQQRQAHQPGEKGTSSSLGKTFLLIGENDCNMVEPALAKEIALVQPQILKSTRAPAPPAKESLHERLYRESLDKKNRHQQLEQRIKSQRVLDEIKECTFHPSLPQSTLPAMVLSERQHPRPNKTTLSTSEDLLNLYQTLQVAPLGTDLSRISHDMGSNGRAKGKVRSPETFYKEMLEFKQSREKKLEKLRSLKLKEENVHRDCLFSADGRSPRSQVLKGPKLGRKRSVAEADAYFRKLSSENLHKHKDASFSQFQQQNKHTKSNESSCGGHKSSVRANNRARATDELYQEHFLRENRRQARQAQEISQVKNVTIDLKRSKQILAQKIAAQINQAYAKVTGCSGPPKGTSCVTIEQLASILQVLGYLTKQVDSAEKSLFQEAWQLLQLNERVSLQNLNIFLAAIDKISLERQDSTQIVSKRKYGGMDADGVFVLSQDAAEVGHLPKRFAIFNKNKQLINEQVRLEQILNMQEASKKEQATFQPKICTRSDRLARKNRSEVLQKQQNQCGPTSSRQVRAVEDRLLLQGDLARQRLISKQSKQDRYTRNKVTSLSPRDHLPLSFTTSQSFSHRSTARSKDTKHFEKLYKEDAEKRQKLEKTRSLKRQLEEKTELAEAVFKPNLVKTRKQNAKVASRHLLVHKQNSGNQTSRGPRQSSSSFFLATSGSQTHRQPINTATTSDNKENNAISLNINQKRNELLKSFLTKPEARNHTRKSSSTLFIQSAGHIKQQQKSQMSDSRTDREIMERLGVATSLTSRVGGNGGQDFCRDKSLLDENSSFTLTTPLDDCKQPLLVANSVEDLTANIQITTKLESQVANERIAMPIGGADISSVLDQTVTAAVNVSNFVYEDRPYHTAASGGCSAKVAYNESQQSEGDATIDFTQYSSSFI